MNGRVNWIKLILYYLFKGSRRRQALARRQRLPVTAVTGSGAHSSPPVHVNPPPIFMLCASDASLSPLFLFIFISKWATLSGFSGPPFSAAWAQFLLLQIYLHSGLIGWSQSTSELSSAYALCIFLYRLYHNFTLSQRSIPIISILAKLKFLIYVSLSHTKRF